MSYRRPHTPEDREAALRLIDRFEAALRGQSVEAAAHMTHDDASVYVHHRRGRIAAWFTSTVHDFGIGVEAEADIPGAALRALRDRLTTTATTRRDTP